MIVWPAPYVARTRTCAGDLRIPLKVMIASFRLSLAAPAKHLPLELLTPRASPAWSVRCTAPRSSPPNSVGPAVQGRAVRALDFDPEPARAATPSLGGSSIRFHSDLGAMLRHAASSALFTAAYPSTPSKKPSFSVPFKTLKKTSRPSHQLTASRQDN